MCIIDDIFTPLYGIPCWSVRSSLGSLLNFEFGEPHLEIREPGTPKPSASARVRRILARREIDVRGEWGLWIEFCGWRFYNNEKEIGSSISSKRAVNRVITEVEGQSLVNVTVEGDGVTVFKFDLGGWLETYPVIVPDENPETMDCWSLFEPSGYVFSLRKDIKYCYKSSKSLITEDDYLFLFPKTA